LVNPVPPGTGGWFEGFGLKTLSRDSSYRTREGVFFALPAQGHHKPDCGHSLYPYTSNPYILINVVKGFFEFLKLVALSRGEHYLVVLLCLPASHMHGIGRQALVF
jgi:hypothetical protein